MKKIFFNFSLFITMTAFFSSCTPTVTIGKQTWTQLNLTTVTYRNGDAIPEVEDAKQWASLTTGAWCYYNGDGSKETWYQKIYNYYALTDPRGLAPSGYHIATADEWETLSVSLGGDNVSAGPLKQSGTVQWKSPNTGTNTSGFEAMPGGFRDIDGSFKDLGAAGNWWAISPAGPWFINMTNAVNFFTSTGIGPKTIGFSVRCVKD
jgi:uncharacterized protein (TIGR02145 family)